LNKKGNRQIKIEKKLDVRSTNTEDTTMVLIKQIGSFEQQGRR